MSVVYPSSIIDQRLQIVLDAIDAGPGNAILEIGTLGMGTILSTVTLLNPCATISAGVMTFLGTPLVDVSAAFTGHAESARITNSDGNVVISGLTVNTINGDILITNQSINSGEIVTFLSGTITGA